jgi:putative SOS response-associated peptidase YedK
MCGRFTLTAPAQDVAEQFGLPLFPSLAPRYNIAPTQPVAAVRARTDFATRELVFLRWGLIPAWAPDPSMGARMLNARAETVADKPAYRSAFARRRCLIPADGFYEWRTLAGKKHPVHFRRRDARPFAFAGLWERWEATSGEVIESCSILTTQANELVRPIHERMPVIVAPHHYDLWLGARPSGTDALRALLRPWPADEMTATPVSTHVNNPRHDDERCLAPA